MEEERVSEIAAEAQAEAASSEDLQSPLLAQSRKLVPWLSWQEWDYVRASFFSSSPDAIAAAMRRVAAWRGRGCLPGVVDVTAAIFEIQLRDPFFRKDLPRDKFSDSDEILSMLYCMSVMRLVNVVVDKVRPTRRMSLADAAIEVGVPRMIIDIRHEGSHRALPSLPIVREASVQALNWLKVYYWEQQRLKTCRQYEISGSRKQVGDELLELVLRMKSGPSNKSSKIKKVLMQLHDTYSFGVVASMVDLMQKVVNSNQLVEVPQDLQSDLSTRTSGDWKILQRLISKLSKKAPHFLLNLLHAVLDMIEVNKSEAELDHHQSMAKYMKEESDQAESLSTMFCWLITLLKDVRHLLLKKPSPETGLPLTEAKLREAILEVLQKCLLVSAGGDKELLNSAVRLAEQLGEEFLSKKLRKLKSLLFTTIDLDEEGTEELNLPFHLTEQEEFIKAAGQKLGSIGFNQVNDVLVEQSGSPQMVRWSVTENWTPCPIGMLPHGLPTLDFASGEIPESSDMTSNEVLSDIKKRSSSCLGDSVDQPSSKRTQITIEDQQLVHENGFVQVEGDSERLGLQELLACNAAAVIKSWI